MNIILFDDEGRSNLLPMVYTRPCGHLRVGILTLAEKWEQLCSCSVSYLTEEYLAPKYPAHYATINFYINGRILADKSLLERIIQIQDGEKLVHEGCLVAFRCDNQLEKINVYFTFFPPHNFIGTKSQYKRTLIIISLEGRYDILLKMERGKER